MKSIALNEAQAKLDELFNDAQAGSPVLLVRGDEVAKLEKVEPPEFNGDRATLLRMLKDAAESPHSEWTTQEVEDLIQRLRENRL